MDAFFGRAGFFRGARCKTLLKMTIPRIKLLRNRRELQLKQMRRDIANLLSSGQEATARIRVEHIIREENMMAAHEILELFCELIIVRLPIIESQRECPLDLKEAISSICFAAPRCADLPELQQAQIMFSGKYGKDFVNAAVELLPDSGVNRQIIELLSVRAPPIDAKLKLLKEIAEEHGVDWDPIDSETTYEDLLNGPSLLISPPPQPQSTKSDQKTDSQEEFDFLDLPEVPKAVPIPTTEREDASSPKASNEFLSYLAPLPKPAAPPLNREIDSPSESTPDALAKRDDRQATEPPTQFLPFILPPLPSGTKQSLPESRPPVMEEAEKLSPPSESSPVVFRKRGELDKELQEAVDAANAAAETAEKAAAAARLAASLAQVKMAELVEKTSPFSEETEKGKDYDSDAGVKPVTSLQTVEDDSLASSAGFRDDKQTLRSLSMDDDPCFSYPNLFSRQNSSAMEPTQIDHPRGT